MKASNTQDGLTLRVIAGIYSIILGIDLREDKREGCLGFSIQRTHLGSEDTPLLPNQQEVRWLPNLLRFPSDKGSKDQAGNPLPILTDTAPIQKFRWGDYTAKPGQIYRYKVIARYGNPGALTDDGPTVEVEVTTEDPESKETAVFFNRGAAASQAYIDKFGNTDPANSPEARVWLSRGLEEAILAYLAQATDNTFALHAAIYEFQKPELLQGLKAAMDRGVEVKVVYHHRPGGDTATKNDAAVAANDLTTVTVPRNAAPTGAISHNKFVVLLQQGEPLAVWTGSTNWTEGAIYGQLNVGHGIYNKEVAKVYESYFQLLHADTAFESLKEGLGTLTPVPADVPPAPAILPIFSPQADTKMLDLYAAICTKAKCLLVCAPFELAEPIRNAFKNKQEGTLRFLLVDKTGSLGKDQDVQVIEGDTGNQVSVATALPSPLHDFQNKLLEGKESFHHAGIHIHAKVILADPFSPDPILVMGSANFSNNSTLNNDSNSLLFRGDEKLADIYTTEFMRMFEHYLFRGTVAQAAQVAKAAGKKPEEEQLGLAEDDSWSAPYYVANSTQAIGRQLFAGTLE